MRLCQRALEQFSEDLVYDFCLRVLIVPHISCYNAVFNYELFCALNQALSVAAIHQLFVIKNQFFCD